MEPLLLSLRDAAAALGVSVGSLRRLIESGRLSSMRVGRRHLVRAADVRKFAQSVADAGTV